MAKRFSETRIWDDVWFQGLPVVWKCLWWYLFSKCDEAGVWKVNHKLAEFQIGQKIKWPEADKILNAGKERVKFNNGFWIIVEFPAFQYGDKVHSSEHPFHKKVRSMLDRVSIPYQYPIDRVKEEEEEKEEVKDKEEEEVIKDLNIILHTTYKSGSKKTKDLIKARLSEGFTIEDFKVVHRKMFRAWAADAKMRPYLRPQTLYGTKFESYLNRPDDLEVSTAGAKTYLAGQEWLKEQGETNG